MTTYALHRIRSSTLRLKRNLPLLWCKTLMPCLVLTGMYHDLGEVSSAWEITNVVFVCGLSLRRNSDTENGGAARRKFSKDTLKGTRILLDGRSSNIFLPLRGTQCNSSCHNVSAQYPKGAATILTVVILDFSTPSGTILDILPPKRRDEHPRYLYIGSPPPSPPLPHPLGWNHD